MQNTDSIDVLRNCLAFIAKLTVSGPQQSALVVNLHNSVSAVIATLSKPDEIKEQSHDITEHDQCEPER